MNSFDPFFSAEYRKSQQDSKSIEQELSIAKMSESQYISEILSSCFCGASKLITEHTQIDLSQEKHIQQQKSQEESVLLSNSSNSIKRSSKNSPFHNFQKHLVITLRQILTLKVISQKIGVQYELAAKIFDYFKKSQKTSRAFLQQVFGLFQTRDQNSKVQFIKIIRKGEMSAILANNSDETIESAQEILRHFAKIEMGQCEIKECLARRKIEKKQEFIEYMGLFKRQLVEGKQRKKTYKLLTKKFQKIQSMKSQWKSSTD